MTTCLHLAVSWGGHAELIPVLLEHGANPNLKNSAGQTPLHAACEHGYKENAKLLLDKGADTSITDNKGLTPAEFAHQNTRIGKDFFELLEKYTKK
jgi:ankyrin repeat protein